MSHTGGMHQAVSECVQGQAGRFADRARARRHAVGAGV